MAVKKPAGLGTSGAALWRDVHEMIDVDGAQGVILLEACRITDRLDRLDRALTAKDFLRVDMDDGGDYVLRVEGALSEARQQANVLKQLIVALRIPDGATGKRPQVRGARGAYSSKGKGSVSSLDRARQAKAGA